MFILDVVPSQENDVGGTAIISSGPLDSTSFSAIISSGSPDSTTFSAITSSGFPYNTTFFTIIIVNRGSRGRTIVSSSSFILRGRNILESISFPLGLRTRAASVRLKTFERLKAINE